MPSTTKRDALVDIVRALPELARSTETVAAIAEAVAEADPSYWLRPLSSAEAAAFLSTTPGALAQARFRGNSPPYGHVGGVLRYASRRELLLWMRAEMGLSDAPTPAGRIAA